MGCSPVVGIRRAMGVRFDEIFEKNKQMIDNGSNILSKVADKNMDVAKRQKKQAELGKLRAKTATKQKELSGIGANICDDPHQSYK